MNRLKIYLAAASAMACLVAPASAAVVTNAIFANGLEHNAVTSNGLGVYALNGVHADGIVLAKSLAPGPGGSVADPNDRNLPAVQKGNVQHSIAGKKSGGLPSSQPALAAAPGSDMTGRPPRRGARTHASADKERMASRLPFLR